MLPCIIFESVIKKLSRDRALVRRICLTLRNISSYYWFTSHEKTAGLVMNCITAIYQPCNVAGVFFCFSFPSSRFIPDRSIQKERPHPRRTCHHRRHLYSMRVASVNSVIAAPMPMRCDDANSSVVRLFARSRSS